MKFLLKNSLFCTALIFSFYSYAQNPNKANRTIDSLRHILRTAKEDTIKIKALTDLCWEYGLKNNYDTARVLAKEAHQLSQKLLASTVDKKYIQQIKKYIAVCLTDISNTYYHQGTYPTALEYGIKASAIHKELGDKRKEGGSLIGIGLIYAELGNYPEALNCYMRSLKIEEELNDKGLVAKAYSNIGLIYRDENDPDKALDYFQRALAMNQEIKDRSAIAKNYGNMGLVYKAKKEYAKALDYYSRALKIGEETGDRSRISIQLGNIGGVYAAQAESTFSQKEKNALYEKALDQYSKALKMKREIQDRHGIALYLCNIGGVYIEIGKFSEAEKFLKRSLEICDSISSITLKQSTEESLSKLFSKTGRYKESWMAYRQSIALLDSLNNEDRVKKQTRMEMQYDFDKKQTADSISNAEQIKQEELKHDQEIKQQKIYTYGGVIGFLLMIIVAGVSFRAYKQKHRANEIIVMQKLLVEEKQREIIDSIEYAKRIQQSLLPTEIYIDKNLKRLKKK